MDSENQQDLQMRLEEMETTVWRLKKGLVSLVVVVALSVAVVGYMYAPSAQVAKAAQTNDPKTIHAKRFVVVDDSGRTRAVLTTTTEGPILNLFDTSGEARMVLSVQEDQGAGLYQYSASGNPKLNLSTPQPGSVDRAGPRLSFADESGTHRLGLYSSPAGPGMAFLDETGTQRLGLIAEKEGPRLAFSDATGTKRMQLRLWHQGLGLALADPSGTNRVSVVLPHQDPSKGGLWVSNAKGSVTHSYP